MLSLHIPSTLNQTLYHATFSPNKRNAAAPNHPLVSTTKHFRRTNASASAPDGALAATDATVDRSREATSLPPSLRPEALPKHVAIIMDGNSRWAKARGLPSSAGHEAGYRALKEIVRLSYKWGIKTLTVFAFSYENWRRPKGEVEFLMTLFESVMKANVGDFMKEGVKIHIIGDQLKLSKSLQKLAQEVEDMTKNNSRLELLVAISYSGRRDITLACQRIAQKVKDGLLEAEDITESVISQELETSCSYEVPDPDLLIRTSGELRLSNFLLWESAYSELFFTNTLWPDFGEADYAEALSAFQDRQRRFGLRIA